MLFKKNLLNKACEKNVKNSKLFRRSYVSDVQVERLSLKGGIEMY